MSDAYIEQLLKDLGKIAEEKYEETHTAIAQFQKSRTPAAMINNSSVIAASHNATVDAAVLMVRLTSAAAFTAAAYSQKQINPDLNSSVDDKLDRASQEAVEFIETHKKAQMLKPHACVATGMKPA